MADGHDHRYSDPANRMSDLIRQHIVNGNSGLWCAVRLSDGGSDGLVYLNRTDAITFQLHETQCCYLPVPPDDMSPKDCESYLRSHRIMYDAGMRLSDPDREVHIPIMTYDALFRRGGLVRDHRYR